MPQVEHGVGRRVVGPVVGHAGHDAARALIHPAEQQSDEEGVGHLRRVHVDEGEEDEVEQED